jgi:large subunit ribosomal protein L20
MVRIKRGNVARLRRKNILKTAKGFRGSHSKLFRIANQQVMKALKYAYVGRKQRKRNFRRLWIVRINTAAHEHNTTYSRLMHTLKSSNIAINRKILAQIIIRDNDCLKKILDYAKK